MTLQKACKRRAWVLYFMDYLVSGVFGMVAQTDGTVSAGNINCIDCRYEIFGDSRVNRAAGGNLDCVGYVSIKNSNRRRRNLTAVKNFDILKIETKLKQFYGKMKADQKTKNRKQGGCHD